MKLVVQKKENARSTEVRYATVAGNGNAIRFNTAATKYFEENKIVAVQLLIDADEKNSKHIYLRQLRKQGNVSDSYTISFHAQKQSNQSSCTISGKGIVKKMGFTGKDRFSFEVYPIKDEIFIRLTRI